MKVDVTIPTKNNQETIGDVLTAVKRNIPYNNIILLDDSSDDTPEIAKQMGAAVHRVEGLLGYKRTMQAKLSATEWIASIDSDIIVYPNWWEEMSRYIQNQNVASIHGYLESDFENLFPEYEKYTKFCAGFRGLFTKRAGAFSNVLVRRTALLQCESNLKGIHAYEDTIIGKTIKNMGQKSIIVKTPVGFHRHTNALKHHIMAYYRMGESLRINNGKAIGFALCVRALFLQYLQLEVFSLQSGKIYIRLYLFIFLLTLLVFTGLQKSTGRKQYLSRRIVSIFRGNNYNHPVFDRKSVSSSKQKNEP